MMRIFARTKPNHFGVMNSTHMLQLAKEVAQQPGPLDSLLELLKKCCTMCQLALTSLYLISSPLSSSVVLYFTSSISAKHKQSESLMVDDKGKVREDLYNRDQLKRTGEAKGKVVKEMYKHQHRSLYAFS